MWSPIYLILVHTCSVLAIWPQPVSISTGSSVLWIEKGVHVNYNGGGPVRWIPILNDVLSSQTERVLGEQVSYSSNQNGFSSNSIVQQAINRALQTLFTQSLVPWKQVERNKLSEFEPPANSQKTTIKTITITQTGADNSSSFKPLAGQVNESYNISIGTDGSASITAVSYVGVIHALESFIQLFYKHSTGGIYTKSAPIEISDAPKFQHRALNFDVSRNWYPVADIKRTIDALSWNKFNILHLHISDAQSWPMEIPAIPELSQEGSYGPGLTYSPNDIKDIQTYAIARGLEIVIEFDMPGHTSSFAYSHPELIAAFRAAPYDTYCAEPPCGALKLNSPAVYDFLEKLFGDVLPRVTPYTSYFHTGGDEVNPNTYLLDDTVNSNDTAVIQPLIQKLVDRNHDQVRKAGLTPMVWEEMLLQWNVTLGDDVVVQAWQSDEAVAQITGKGHKVVGGNYNFWVSQMLHNGIHVLTKSQYLDCGRGQWLNFENGASYQQFYPFLDYCSPNKNWRLVYSYDPLASVPANETHLVLGAEVHIWSEQTDPTTIDSMLWPRAAAAGEVLWSGRQDASGQNRSQITAAPRLSEMRERMLNRGVQAGIVQMIFCTQYNATECSI
jgi:hexosaminidase